MLKRRITFLLGSVVLLLIIFSVYKFFADRGVPTGPDEPAPQLEPVAQQDLRQPEAQAGKGLAVLDRDEEGRVRGLYKAERSRKQPDGSYLLTEPHMEIYQKDGRGTVIRADRGWVYAEQAPSGFDVRRATLSGNVQVTMEVEAPDTPGAEEKIRIYVDDIEFDRELLTLYTDSPVRLFSNIMDIVGEGLTISWNEEPDELRVLRIERGQYMAVYNVPEGTGVALPGGTASEAAPATSRPSTRPSTAPSAHVTATTNETPPVSTQPTTSTGPVAPTRPSTTAPQSATAPAPVEQPQGPRNIYYAEFQGTERLVNVDFRQSEVSGLEALGLTFEWDRSQPTPWPRGEPTTQATTRPGSRPSSPATRPGSEKLRAAPGLAADTAPAAATGPASKPVGAAATRPAQSNTMVITWSGPLVIRPVGRTESPSSERYEIHGRGRRVILSEPRGVAVCGEFSFDNATKTGWLERSEGQPVWLGFADGAEVVCRRVRIDRSREWIDLHGPGWMLRRPSDQETPLTELAETGRHGSVEGTDRIRWRDLAKVKTGQRLRRGPEGTRRRVETVEEVHFSGGVELVSETQDTSVRCRRLEAQMAEDSRGRPYPSECLATGDVQARQEDSRITCRKMRMTFQETSADQRQTAEGSLGQRGDIILKTLTADGDVHVLDESEDEPTEAFADHLDSDAVARTAVLTGNPDGEPAKIARGTSVLTGRRIELDEAEGSAHVPGAGTLDFDATRDLNAAKLDTPRPVHVTWDESMTYKDATNSAIVKGNVDLGSGLDRLVCETMRLYFSEPEEGPTGREADASSPGRANPLALEELSGREINTILAEQNVILSSRRDDANGKLLRRLQLKGDDLRVYPPQERMDVVGYGQLVVEDYRRPPAEDMGAMREDTPLVGGDVPRPSQTAMIWHDKMQLWQRERMAVLSGNVSMSHRRGNKVPVAEGLNVDGWWAALDEGREARLRCETMMAKFDKPDSDQREGEVPSEPGTTEPGPRLGPLALFTATGDVNLMYGGETMNQILGQRLIYDRHREIAIVHGNLKGEPPALATISAENQVTGRSNTWTGEDLTCYLRDGEIDRVVSGPVRAAGGR